MKDKLLKFFKDNFLFIIFVIPFVFICIANKKPDNDIWFLLSSGRYIFKFGVPTIDPFTVHEGLSYIMQQWLSAAIFWKMFDWFGKTGLLIIVFIMSLLLMIMIYKLYYRTSNNKVLSIIFTSIAVILLRKFIVLRPQLFSNFLLIVELYLVESYVNTNNKKYLWGLPILSLLLINLHASMWYFQFVFLLPFIVNSFKIKKFTIQNYDLKPILKIIIFMIIVGFINPYGFDALTYLFKSYGIDLINLIVSEMRNITFDEFGKVTLALTLLVILSINFFKDLKLDVRHICFFCGTSILAHMHIRCYCYFVVLAFYCLAYLYKDFSFNKVLDKVKVLKNVWKNKYVKGITYGVVTGCTIMLFITIFVTAYSSIKYFYFHPDDLEDAVAYIKDNYDSEKVILFIDYNNGGYTEFMGLKSYIDPRAEVFFKKLNGKEDIFEEYAAISSSQTFKLEEFVEKYKFTHLIVFYNQYYLDEYMETRDDYEIVYREYLATPGEHEYLKIYALMDLKDKKEEK